MFFLLSASSNQVEALEAALGGGLPAFMAKFPAQPKAYATGRVWEGGQLVQGVVADALESNSADACFQQKSSRRLPATASTLFRDCSH
jgi:hypothetical protein